jgi:hypothetical protein
MWSKRPHGKNVEIDPCGQNDHTVKTLKLVHVVKMTTRAKNAKKPQNVEIGPCGRFDHTNINSISI